MRTMRHFVSLSFLSLFGASAALAMPGSTINTRNSAGGSWAAALEDVAGHNKTYIDIGLNVAVTIKDKKTACSKTGDYDNCVYTLAAEQTNGTAFTITWTGDNNDPQQAKCVFMGHPTGEAEFAADASSCFLRSVADGTNRSHGVSFGCDPIPSGGLCH